MGGKFRGAGQAAVYVACFVLVSKAIALQKLIRCNIMSDRSVILKGLR